jgi:hypothetical protein
LKFDLLMISAAQTSTPTTGLPAASVTVPVIGPVSPSAAIAPAGSESNSTPSRSGRQNRRKLAQSGRPFVERV